MLGCSSCCGKWEVTYANFETGFGADLNGSTVLVDNVAAGSGAFGYKYNSQPPHYQSGNVAHSNQFGLVFNKGWHGDKAKNVTVRLHGYQLRRSWVFALWGHSDAETVEVSGTVIADSKVGMTWGAVGPSSSEHIIGDNTVRAIRLRPSSGDSFNDSSAITQSPIGDDYGDDSMSDRR